MSSTSALLVSADSYLRFLPAADYFGDPGTLSIRAIDDSYLGHYSSSVQTPSPFGFGSRVTMDAVAGFVICDIFGDWGRSHGGAMGDVDGDGDLDIYVANYYGDQNNLWINDGSGTFTSSDITGDTGSSRGAVMGDVDGDGDLDIYVANLDQNNLWINDGKGNFTARYIFGDTGWSAGAVMGDVDGDGDLDIYTTNLLVPGFSGQNNLCINDGSGNFTTRYIPGDTGDSFGAVMGDVDGDGHPDVYVAGKGQNRMWINCISKTSNTDRTVSITVTPVKEQPQVSDLSGTLTYGENDGPQVIDGSITVTDVDSTNLTSATIQITDNYRSGEDVLAIAPSALVSEVRAEWDSATGTVTLVGSAPLAEYESMLEHVRYTNTSDNPDTGNRTVTWTVNDSTLDSAPQTSTIAVTATNDPPTSTGVPNPEQVCQGFGTQTYDVSGYFSDVDGPALTYELGALTYHNGLTLTDVTIDPGSGVITFTNDANAWGSVEVQVRANDGSLCCDWQTFTFTVNPVNNLQPQPTPQPTPELNSMPNLELPNDPELETLHFHQSSGVSFPLDGLSLGYSDTFASQPDGIGLLHCDYSESYETGKDSGSSPLEDFLSGSLFGKAKDQSFDALHDLAGLGDDARKPENTEVLLGLEEFLARLKERQIGDESEDIKLAFNAGEIKLAEWIGSQVAPDYWPNEPHDGGSVHSDSSAESWLQGKTLVFDLDNIRVTDIFASGSIGGLLDKLGHPEKPTEGLTSVLDLNEVHFSEVLAG